MADCPKNQCSLNHSPDFQYKFDNIYNEEITKRYDKHEIQRLSSAKRDIRERKIGAGRPFKLDLKDRFVMLLV